MIKKKLKFQDRKDNPISHYSGKPRINKSDFIKVMSDINILHPSGKFKVYKPRKEWSALSEKYMKLREKSINRKLNLANYFNLNYYGEYLTYITKKYPHLINSKLPPNSKYKLYIEKTNTKINFRWYLDKEKNTVHMFEFLNEAGLSSKNPIYKEFKNSSINEIKEKLKISDLKFIVDSEIIDKFS